MAAVKNGQLTVFCAAQVYDAPKSTLYDWVLGMIMRIWQRTAGGGLTWMIQTSYMEKQLQLSYQKGNPTANVRMEYLTAEVISDYFTLLKRNWPRELYEFSQQNL